MSMRTQHFGAVPQDQGYTRFSIWAPDAQDVHLQFRQGETLPMERRQEWFELITPAADGIAYRFIIDNELPVPDPAANAQRIDVNNWSLVVDHSSYQWNCNDWRGRPWHETVIYELHVGLMGGFAGVIKHLPLLMELGVTAIELMPLNEFPGSRNWGYDGALLFAPDASYGTPDELKQLIDCAHELGIMVFVDVVYNHFGPDGNYLSRYASHFFREDVHTPWGAAIDFRRNEVREFFIENALMWLLDYRVDGLRFDAVHAIQETDFLVTLAAQIRAAVAADRHIHLMLENENNCATLLKQGFTAQWNDDGHNVLHHLLTGEQEGYYTDFVEQATAKLARFLSEGFIFQGEITRHGKPRGEPSKHLPPTSFILFLQNHDQIGNRAFGERLPQLASKEALEAATVLLLLSPMVPLLFMGEEWGAEQPFLYFTDHKPELAEAVRDGRRNEFSAFSLFGQEAAREKIPDPNAIETFNQSRLDFSECLQPQHRERLSLYRELLSLRTKEIIPRLPGASAIGTKVLDDKAVSARWLLNDGRELRIDINLGEKDLVMDSPWTTHRILYSHRVSPAHYRQNILPAYSALASLEHPQADEDGLKKTIPDESAADEM
jgi:maltooligosyltrehalose trehalohydrolase